MDNLEIQVQQQLGTISTNFEEVEKQLRLQMSAYESFVVSEDEINIAKGDLAFLRKLKTSIEDKRKAIKKEYNKPYEAFEESCKKLTAIVDEPINLIDGQLKMFEADRVEKKQKRVTKMYEEQVGELIRFLPVEKYYNEKWNNKSVTNQDISFDISAMVLKVKNDLDAIKALHSGIEEECINAYAESGNDLSKAIARNSQYLSDKQKVVEQTKKEEPVESKPIKQLDNLAKQRRMVYFVVSEADAEQVRELLEFSNIKFREE